MKKRSILLLICSILLAGFGAGQTGRAKEISSRPRLIVGYLPSFRLEHFAIRELETRGAAERMTHILYAFANVTNAHPTLDDDETEYGRPYRASESVDGKADDAAPAHTLRGAFNQLRKLKTRHSQLKVLMSIGGANPANSKGFSLASRPKNSRQKFVAP